MVWFTPDQQSEQNNTSSIHQYFICIHLDIVSVQDLMKFWLWKWTDEVRKDHGNVLQRILGYLRHLRKHHSSNQIPLTWWCVNRNVEITLVGGAIECPQKLVGLLSQSVRLNGDRYV